MKNIIIYFIGMILLAFGLTTNALTGLGSSPLLSVDYVISIWKGISFANLTFIHYAIFVIVQLILVKEKTKKNMLMILLQIPFSLVFTRIMALVKLLVDLSECSFLIRMIWLIAAIILIGIGAAMMLQVHWIPNPGDGIVQCVASVSGKKVGTIKNIFDISHVLAATILSYVTMRSFDGIGIGSILSMLFIGRVIALYNRIMKINQ